MALTEQELDYLEEFLLSGATGEECMDLVSLDGFLTALAIGPERIEVSTWLPIIWGGIPTPLFDSPQQGVLIETLITRRFEEIVQQFAEDPAEYCPTLYEFEIDGQQVFSLEEWCIGFMIAIEHQAPLWQPLFESHYHRFLFPFIFFSLENLSDQFGSLDENPVEFMERLLGALVPSLGVIYAFWHGDPLTASANMEISNLAPPEKPATFQPLTLTLEEGFPDFCPCGSELPFKNCCGSKARLH